MKKTDKTREQILQVAQHLFQQFGFDKTSMDEIARVSHKAKRSIYYHFIDKEELFKAVIEKELRTIQNELQQIFEKTEQTPAERMKIYLIKRMELLAEAGAYQQILKLDIQNNINLRFPKIETIRRAFDEWEYGLFFTLSKKGVEDQLLNPDFNCEAFADMLQMILKSLDISFFVQEKYMNYKNTFVTLINIIIDNLIYNNNSNHKYSLS